MGKFHKWNEITYETMKEVFTSFINRENWTKDVVLEIQDPVAIRVGKPRRFYLGSCINMRDFLAYDEPYVVLLERISEKKGLKVEDFFEDFHGINLCILEDKNPTIIPIFAKEKQCEVILATCFGDPGMTKEEADTSQVKWYIKDAEGQRYIDQSPQVKYSDKERLIRTRVVDYDKWFDNIMSYLEKGKDLEGCEEDFKPGELLCVE